MSFVVINPLLPEPIYWPTYINDYASKHYVDVQIVSSGLTFDAPLSLNIGTKHVSINDATVSTSGTVSAGTQTFGGDKTFHDKVFVNAPGTDSEPATKKYTDDLIAGVTLIPDAPIQIDSGTHHISVLPASGTQAGIITTGTQNIAGNKTFLGLNLVPTPLALADVTQIANVDYVTGQISGMSYTASLPISIVSKDIRMSEASYALTAAGYVNNTTQSFAGKKGFPDGATTVTVTSTDASTNIATTQFVNTATQGIGYSSNNGWISGCFLDRVPTLYPKPQPYPNPFTDPTYMFHISPGKVRFTIANTDATAASPTITRVLDMFQPAGYTALSLFPNSNSVGIYVDMLGNVYQYDSPTDPSQMYDKVQIGVLLQTQVEVIPTLWITFIIDASNVKFPIASNYDLSLMEFVNYITPINLGPMNITASLTVVDYSIASSGGAIWEQMANLMPNISTTNRSNPSTITFPAIDRPVMFGFCQIDSSTYHAVPASDQIDTTQYNLKAMGGLIPIPDITPWVTYPILFNSAVGLYFWQYPTDSYGTEAAALAAVGKFTRMTSSSQFRLLNVVGYVTCHKHDPANGYIDFSNAFFGGGEFFNYGVGGSSGASGGGGSSAAYLMSNNAWIDQSGSDVTGAWAYSNKPFLTYDYPAAQILDASAAKPYLASFSPGAHTLSTLQLVPYIHINGNGERSSMISCAVPVTCSAAWATTADVSITISNLFFVSGTSINFDLYNNFSSTTSVGTIIFDNVAMKKLAAPLTVGTLTFKGRAFGAAPATQDYLTIQQFTGDVNLVFDGGNIISNNCQIDPAYTITISATNVDTTVILHTMEIGNLVVNPPAPGVTMSVLINSCIIRGTFNVVAGATVRIDRASITSANIGLGTVIFYDDQLTQAQVDALSLPYIANALSTTNPVIEKTGLTSTLTGYVPTTRTVNGRALSANVTVLGGDLPAIGVPGATKIDHSLLDITSADLPNPAAISITGTAYNLASGQTDPVTLPSNIRGTTALITDNTTLLATNAFVHNYVNFATAGGAAQLDGTGKVPTSQLPDSVLGAMQYKGTFNADSGVYPITPPYTAYKGWYYICATAHGGTVNDGINIITYAPSDWATCDGTKMDKIDNQNVANYVNNVWTGSSNITTLGTIVAGTWASLTAPISYLYGGAGGVTGILKTLSGNGVVSAATHTTAGDYVAPDDPTTLAGVKTFTNGLISNQTFTIDENDTYVATTAFVHANANVPQNNVIFVSSAGSNLNSGRTINAAVLTFAQAITNCTGHSAAIPYVIKCLDAEINAENIVLQSYISIDAPNMTFTGDMSIADDCFVNIGYYSAAGALFNTITFTNVTTEPSMFKAKTAKKAYIVLSAASVSPSYRYLDVDQLDLYALNCEQNCTLFVKSRKITGYLFCTTASTILDLTEVGDVSTASITATAPGVVKYPVSTASAVTGIVKCDGKGGFTAASSGTDYIISSQALSLTGTDVTGSGTIGSGVTATIANNAVTFAKMQQLTAPSVIGSFTASGATPLNATQLPLVATSTATTIPFRDASANITANNFIATYNVVAGTSNVYLFSYSNQIQDFTNTAASQWVMLPNCMLSSGSSVPLSIGFKFTIINSSAVNALTVVYYTVAAPPYSGPQILATITPLTHSDIICTGASSSAGTWIAADNSIINLSGAVTGSGTTAITTSFANSALNSIASGNVLGNISGSAAAPAAVAIQSAGAAGANTIALRDGTTNNIGANAFIQTFLTNAVPTTTVTMTGSSAPFQEYTGNNTVIYKLPVIGTIANNVEQGYTCILFNKSSSSSILTVQNSAGGAVTTIAANLAYKFIAKAAANTWLFYQTNYTYSAPTITLSGAVTGSGTDSFVTSYGSIAANSIIANLTGSAAVPIAMTIQSTAGPNTAAMRDATTGNILANAFCNAFSSGSTTPVVMTGVTPPIQEYSSSALGAGTFQLPVIGTGTTTVPVGYMCKIINNSSYAVTVNSSTPAPIATIASGNTYNFVAKGAAATWLYYQTNNVTQTITLTGAVTGSGTGSFVTSYGSIAANSIMANLTGSAAAPTAMIIQSTAGLNTAVMRDVNTGNIGANAMMQSFATNSTPTTLVTLTGLSAPVQEYTGAGIVTYNLPVIGSAATDVPVGYACIIINTSASVITVKNSGGITTVVTIAAGLTYKFVAKTAAVTWLYWQANSTAGGTITLSGAVTGSGTSAITTAYGAIAANSLMANTTAGSAVPIETTVTNLATASAVMVRDTSANVQSNSFISNITSRTAGVNLAATDSQVQVFTAITTPVTVALPSALTIPAGTSYLIINDSVPSASGTGEVSVTDNVGTVICGVTPTMRCKYILVTDGSQAGTWTKYYRSSIPPQLFPGTSFTTGPTFISGSQTLTAALMYSGHIICGGASSSALTLPTVDNMIGTSVANGLWSILKTQPPNGFNFPLIITNTISSAGAIMSMAAGGATMLGTTFALTSTADLNFSLYLQVYIVSSSVTRKYMVMSVRNK